MLGVQGREKETGRPLPPLAPQFDQRMSEGEWNRVTFLQLSREEGGSLTSLWQAVKSK